MNKTILIITARMSSQRLPGKVMMKIKKIPIIKLIILRLKLSKLVKNIIVSTSTDKTDDILVKYLKKNKINYYRGSKNNVTKRVLDTAKLYKAKNIILITGDCPLVDPDLVDQCINIFKNNKAEFVTNANIRSYPDGLDVQVFKYSALFKLYKKIIDQKEYEHVTLALRKKLNKNKIINVVSGKDLYFPKLGITLDETKDFKLINKIYLHFWDKYKYNFKSHQIIDFLKKNKKLLKINIGVKRKGDN